MSKKAVTIILTAIWPGLGHIAAGQYKKSLGILGTTMASHIPPFTFIGVPIRLGLWIYSMVDIIRLTSEVCTDDSSQSGCKQD